ncbi:Uncharacterized protein FKW44_020837 [Caligus rogercresseyi]|uniref:Condensin II complex subunit H2 N-terminal domain-containing protein n=1 Tax=Caligus rogercresseyi TaxID=217165 RepID=A0A7T8GQK4_CALRO|nr:Uncharacterized protein FKW44_020837 [Caligus rogercresseyi]
MTPSEDPRFAELLRPIKDLTANFNVPLSQFLDIYFTDLRDDIPDLTLDSQSLKRVDFVKAGLLLQGTASVYSRKWSSSGKVSLRCWSFSLRGDHHRERVHIPEEKRKKEQALSLLMMTQRSPHERKEEKGFSGPLLR